MQAAPPTSPTIQDESVTTSPRDVAVSCTASTLDALLQRGHLQAAERQHIQDVHLEELREGKDGEVFETITRLSTIAPREIPNYMADLGLAVAKTLKDRVPLIPKLNRARVPSAFYKEFPDLHDLARALLTPVIYSEDNDAIAVGSVNPIPALALSHAISNSLSEQNGTRPFLSTVRMDYDAWHSQVKKHFGL